MAMMDAHDIALLPDTAAVMARTRAVDDQYPGALPRVVLDHMEDCARVRGRWKRLVHVADMLAKAAGSVQPADEAVREAMAEAEVLIADDRLSHKALVAGVRLSVEASLVELNRRRGLEDRAQDLRRGWKAFEAEAQRQGCHPFQVAGCARFLERLSGVGQDLPPDLAALPDLAVRHRRVRRERDRLVAFDARRRKIIRRAARWLPETPLERSRLTSYGRWARAAPKMIDRGKRLMEDALLSPQERKTLEKTLERIIATLDGCGLEARHLRAFEEIMDKADAQGCHRYFVEGYEAFYKGLGAEMLYSPGRNSFATNERQVRDDMHRDEYHVHALDRDLTEALRQRQEGGDGFVKAVHPYARWKREAQRNLESVPYVLKDRARYGPHLARVPGLEQRLRATVTSVSDLIERDAPVRTKVEAAYRENVRYERELRARARELDRRLNPSRSRGIGIEM